jgi:hypothetical protein
MYKGCDRNSLVGTPDKVEMKAEGYIQFALPMTLKSASKKIEKSR